MAQSQKMLQNPSAFIKTLKGFDNASVTKSQMKVSRSDALSWRFWGAKVGITNLKYYGSPFSSQALAPIVEGPDFKHDSLAKTSAAAANLGCWIRGVYNYNL